MDITSFESYKDYTNICGTPFQPFVDAQIKKRKELVSKEIKDNPTTQWLHNRTTWIKISSGVDVDYDNPNFIEKGDRLAQKYTLQSGLKDNNSNSLREGIGPDNAYGIGGNDFGYRPMPGITNLSISTGGRLGTLREATIDFICYNKSQLDIMDALYMKLGMSVLIEWGHIPYIKNDGTLETNPITSDFYSMGGKEQLIKDIQSNRELSYGNYDAMWGTIKNFQFSLGENGTFKCQTVLVGAGDILESLKINQSHYTSNQESESIYPVVADANKSYLNNSLYNLWSSLQNFGPGKHKIGGDYFKLVQQYLSPLDVKFSFPLSSTSFNNNSPLVKTGFQYAMISGREGKAYLDNIPQISPSNFFAGVNIPMEINGVKPPINPTDNTQPGHNQIYITLGHLLLLVMSNGNIFDKTNQSSEPYLYIDVNTETNRCYTFPGHCSLNPEVCLIGSEKLPLNIINTKFFINLKEAAPFFDDINPKSGGRFMYTLVNINYVVNILSSLSNNDSKGNVYFIDFLQELLKGISKACGGFNEYRIVPDDDTRCIRIFDDKRITPPLKTSTKSPSPYTIIPVMGKDSLAYNFNYTSKISPNTAIMTVISSQAEPTGVDISEEALAFSKLRDGLTNRLSPTRVDSTQVNTSEKTSNEGDPVKELQFHLAEIYEGFIDNPNSPKNKLSKYNSDKFDSCLNTYRKKYSNTIPNSLSDDDQEHEASIILPLDFSLEMDGISGIIPNSAFEIPSNSLPNSYLTKDSKEPKIAFILHTIDHNFNNNKWTTKITGQTLNIRFDPLSDKEKLRRKTLRESSNLAIPSSANINPITNFIAGGPEAKITAEIYLGRKMTDKEWTQLVSATFAESSRNQTEQAYVMAVILNRARHNNSTISDVLSKPGQFEAVTGKITSNRNPQINYLKGPTPTIASSIYWSTQNLLLKVPKNIEHFTSNNPSSYDPKGKGISYMYQLRKTGFIIGKTIFSK